MTLEARLLTRSDDLVRLLPDWWALWNRAADTTPFQSPAWLLPWWQVFHPGDLMTVAVLRDGRLVGLAPFYREDGALGRRLLPLGIGVTDYLDVLIDGAPAEAVGDSIARCLTDAAADWDVWSLEELRPDAVARTLSLGTLPVETRPQSACPVLTLPATDAEWRGTRAELRWRKAWNRVMRHPQVRIVEADADTAGSMFEHVIALHTRRWQSAAQPGVLADPDVCRFHRAAVPHLAASKLLRLYALEIDGLTVAAFYGFAHRGHCYAYLNGFDPVLAFESPGTVLIGHAMREAVAQGGGTFHFLRGQESYKYAWGAEDRWNVVRSARHGLDPAQARKPDRTKRATA